MAIDAGRAMAFFTSEQVSGVEVVAGVFVGAEVLAVAYGGLCCGAGAEVLKGN